MIKKIALVTVVMCAACLGCSGSLSDEPERVLVSGTVSYAGQEIAEGEIRFVPTEGTIAPSSSAIIKDGAYRADHKGGVPVGTHRVEIRAYRPDEDVTGEIPGVPEGEVPKEQFLPAKYNAESDLTLTVESGSDPITKDYDLEE